MKKKLLTTAVLAGIAGTAGAVNINPDGLGQVGIFPYYTVQSGNTTLISITNTSETDAKAIKVRILEGKNSREVLDFNLYLSPSDIWTAAISPDGTTGAKIATTDKSCTVPAIPAAGVTFRNFEYVGTKADGEDTSLARTREGHIEILEMGTLGDAVPGGGVAGNQAPFNPKQWSTHVSGVPFSCTNLVNAWSSGIWTTVPSTQIFAPNGGLYAGAIIVNVAAGAGNANNAVMLDAFRTAQVHTGPGDLSPSLAQASPASSIVFNNGAIVSTNWTGSNPGAAFIGLNAVSATLMRKSVMNDFSVDTTLAAATDWVVTFPTKRDYVAHPGAAVALVVRPPFTTNFGAGVGGSPSRAGAKDPVTFPPTTGGACEVVTLKVWDREEFTPGSGIDFSPQDTPGSNSLCWETNVITFGSASTTSALGSSLRLNVNPPVSQQNGWMRLTFSDAGHLMTSNPVFDGGVTRVYGGLPVVGFAVQNYINNAVSAGVLANYGVLFDHRYTRSISP